MVRINYVVTTVMDSYTASPSELKLNTFVGDSLNSFTQLWLARADTDEYIHTDTMVFEG